MSTHHSDGERAGLVALFRELGPDAPTLCGDWTTFDLAVHLVVRERNPIGAPGIVFGGPAERLTDWAMDRERKKGYATVVDRVAATSLPMRAPFLKDLVNLQEYFVHFEDVRRANGLTPRPPAPALDDALAGVVGRFGKVMARRAKVRAVFERETGEVLIGERGELPVTITGRPGELLLWLLGRDTVADVRFAGPSDAVAEVERSKRGI